LTGSHSVVFFFSPSRCGANLQQKHPISLTNKRINFENLNFLKLNIYAICKETVNTDGVLKLLSPGTNFKESILFQKIDSASLCRGGLVRQLGSNSVPTQFLAPIDCSKIQALSMNMKTKIKTIYLPMNGQSLLND
jgi:hypothetical protein